jgi:hypothetical protein
MYNDMRLANATVQQVRAMVKTAFGVSEATVVPSLVPSEIVRVQGLAHSQPQCIEP